MIFAGLEVFPRSTNSTILLSYLFICPKYLLFQYLFALLELLVIRQFLMHFNLPNVEITFTPRLSSFDFFKTLKASRLIVSIPSSDSSPRTVYEAMFLKKQLFLSNLRCFEWIPSFDSLPFIYSTSNVALDAASICNFLILSKKSYSSEYNLSSSFYMLLNYKYIAKSFAKVFRHPSK